MSIVKVIELISEGSTIEKAAESAVEEAAKTVRNIKSVYISDIQAIVDKNKVVKYRIDVRVSFVVGS
jgi:flavin-binding protein dodecin